MKSANRRRSPRFKAQLKARLLFTVVLSEETSASRSGRLHLVGHTKDISEIGLALVVPIVEIDERYLKGESSKMQIELFLPKGAVKITARPVHYKRLDENSGENVFTEGYLIGAEITKVSDHALFADYLGTLEGTSGRERN
ncbi:MAG TPA: PilZ domain-containing protein [Pyrinomonadaceae bacterium]|nr:PilZ domain-containing protein [Pyrinomonadaceae bacterium]